MHTRATRAAAGTSRVMRRTAWRQPAQYAAVVLARVWLQRMCSDSSAHPFWGGRAGWYACRPAPPPSRFSLQFHGTEWTSSPLHPMMSVTLLSGAAPSFAFVLFLACALPLAPYPACPRHQLLPIPGCYAVWDLSTANDSRAAPSDELPCAARRHLVTAVCFCSTEQPVGGNRGAGATQQVNGSQTRISIIAGPVTAWRWIHPGIHPMV